MGELMIAVDRDNHHYISVDDFVAYYKEICRDKLAIIEGAKMKLAFLKKEKIALEEQLTNILNKPSEEISDENKNEFKRQSQVYSNFLTQLENEIFQSNNIKAKPTKEKKNLLTIPEGLDTKKLFDILCKINDSELIKTNARYNPQDFLLVFQKKNPKPVVWKSSLPRLIAILEVLEEYKFINIPKHGSLSKIADCIENGGQFLDKNNEPIKRVATKRSQSKSIPSYKRKIKKYIATFLK